jgi:ubiquinone/menaquinone biosynthesis C-methylase UbiE
MRLLDRGYRDYFETIQSYNIIAEGYRFWRAKPWPITKVVRGRTVLDAGSGPCVNGVEVALRNSGYVVCLDISKSMAYTAREVLEKRMVLGDAVVGDAISMPIRSSSLDAVISIALVHHLPRELAWMFFTEVQRVVKVGGMLLVTIWLWKQRRFLLHTIINYIKTLGGLLGYPRRYTVYWRTRKGKFKRIYYLYTEKELANLITKSNLNVVSQGLVGYLKNKSNNIYVVAVKSRAWHSTKPYQH